MQLNLKSDIDKEILKYDIKAAIKIHDQFPYFLDKMDKKLGVP